MPSITPDVANALVHTSAHRLHSSSTGQSDASPTFSAFLDANVAGNNPPTAQQPPDPAAANSPKATDGNSDNSASGAGAKDRTDAANSSPTGQNPAPDPAKDAARPRDPSAPAKQAANPTAQASAGKAGTGNTTTGAKWLRALTNATIGAASQQAAAGQSSAAASATGNPAAGGNDPSGNAAQNQASATAGNTGATGTDGIAQTLAGAPGAPGVPAAGADSNAADLAAALVPTLDGGAKPAGKDAKAPPAADDGDNDDDSSATTKSDAAGGSTGQAIAAALTLGNAGDAAAPPAAPSLSAATVGAAAKAHARATLALADGPDRPATPDAKDAISGDAAGDAAKSAETAKPGASTNAPADGNGAQPASADTSSLTQPNGAPQGFARTDSDAFNFAQTATNATGDGDHASSHSDATAAASGGAATVPTGAAKADGGSLPNFGIANAVAPAAVSNVDKTASPGVPIAGLALAISARARAGANQFDIRLDPPELGRIDVRLDVDRSTGQVTSHVTVDRADTLQLLQSQQPQLERALEQAGLKTAENGLQFTLRDQSFSGQNNNGGSGAQAQTAQLVIPDADLPPVQTTQIYSRFGRVSGIDIRV